MTDNLEEYLQELPVSKAEKERCSNDISEFLAMLNELGHTWPNEADYIEFIGRKKEKVGKHRTQAYQPAEKSAERVRAYFKAQGVSESYTIEQPETAKPKGKSGRRVIDKDGNKRSAKLMVYLTPPLMADIKDLASSYGKSVADCVFTLIERYVAEKQNRLETYRTLKENEE